MVYCNFSGVDLHITLCWRKNINYKCSENFKICHDFAIMANFEKVERESLIMKKFLNHIANIIEIYTPVICFIVMYLTFLLAIFYRYILNNPIAWSLELVRISFLWAALLSISFTFKTDSHVKFDLIYNLLDERKKIYLRLVGNIIMLIAFILLIEPTISYFMFVKRTTTSIFRLRYDFVYFPFLVMIFMMIVRLFKKITKEFIMLMRENKKNKIVS